MFLKRSQHPEFESMLRGASRRQCFCDWSTIFTEFRIEERLWNSRQSWDRWINTFPYKVVGRRGYPILSLGSSHGYGLWDVPAACSIGTRSKNCVESGNAQFVVVPVLELCSESRPGSGQAFPTFDLHNFNIEASLVK